MSQPSSPLSAQPSATHRPMAPEAEWLALVATTPEPCRAAVAAVVRTHGPELAAHFYGAMMADHDAANFLDHTIVNERLRGSMARWLEEIFIQELHDEAQAAAVVAHQRHVGEVHARIRLPIYLVARGARVLKAAIFHLLAEQNLPPEQHLRAMPYVGQVMDLALELMSAAFVRNSERSARADEAYRLFSLGQNMSVERERQRSVLLEWGQEVLFMLHRPSSRAVLPNLAHSEFGLWLNHKARMMFEGSEELGQIQDIVERVDSALLPQLRVADPAAPQLNTLVGEFYGELDSLKFLLSSLFERYLEVENGRDALTRLLNRRFLPSVLSREIALYRGESQGFALLLLDIDHFKNINDSYGHDSGDAVLQQASALVLNAVRSGDFVFRYGGEEILVILVEVNADATQRIAESIRQKFDSGEFLISDGRALHVTVSIGVAQFDGHPDYQYLINRADAALYAAKQQGRNRVCQAPAE